MKKRKIRILKKKFCNGFSNIATWIIRNSKIIIYSVVFIIGLAIIVTSFFVEDNWINVCAGVGTGILTSLTVSIIMNAENNAREKRKREEEKRYLLNNIIETSLDVYADIIHRINEFITLTEIESNSIYGLYDDFSKYNEFEKHIKNIDLDNCSEELNDRINKLFNISNYRLDHLIVELKQIPKQEYFLRGILTSKECSNLISNYENDRYLQYAATINDFWNDRILDKEKCISFLRMTIYICSKTIACFDYSKKKAKYLEEDISKIMDQLYFDEVYSKSEAYFEEQLARVEAEDQYYAEHPEEWEALQQSFLDMENETEEDRVLKDLYCCICGFSIYKIEDLIAKLDADSSVVMNFFKSEKIRIALRKKRKLRKVVINKFGKNILK